MYFLLSYFFSQHPSNFVQFKRVGEPAICAQEACLSKPSVLMETARKKRHRKKSFTGADGMTHCDLYKLQITKHQQVVDI